MMETSHGFRAERPAGAVRPARRPATLLAALGLAAALAAGDAPAQVTADRGATEVRYHRIGLTSAPAGGLESVSLLTVPVTGRASLGERLTLGVGGYWAHGSVDRARGGSSEVSGLTDLTVTASLELGDGAATVSAVGQLPTGREGYTVGELDLVGALASDLFPFQISNWGTGGGGGLRVSTTREVGPFGAALSAGYFVSGEFDAVEDRLIDYRPGDQLNLRAALTAPVGRAGQLALQGGFRRFGDDEAAGDEIFEAGNRYDGLASYSFAVGGESAGFVYGGYRHRSEGRQLQLRRPTSSQDMVVAGGGLRLRAGDVRLRPEVRARLLEREDDTSEGYGVRVGGRAEWPVGGATLVPVLRGDFGSVTVREGRESGYLGVEVGLGVRLGGGR